MVEGLASVQKVGMMEGYRGGSPGTVSADCNQDFEVYPLHHKRVTGHLLLARVVWLRSYIEGHLGCAVVPSAIGSG